MSPRSGLTALYVSRDVGFAVGAVPGLSPKAASKCLGDAHATPGRRGRALWTWIEDHDLVHRPAAYAVWSRIEDSTPEAGYVQIGLSFVAEMFADEVQVPIVRGSDTIMRAVLGANYPHHHAGLQAWARDQGHDRTNADAIFAAALWHWAAARLGKTGA